MTVVTASDFRSNMSKYFGMVDGGEELVLKSRKGEYRLRRVSQGRASVRENPKRDVTAEVCQAMKDWKEYLETGKSDKFRPASDLLYELRNLNA